MWLRALAGAYAGQIRDFRTDVGLRALRSGMAARVEDVQSPAPSSIGVDLAAQPDQTAIVVKAGKRKSKK